MLIIIYIVCFRYAAMRTLRVAKNGLDMPYETVGRRLEIQIDNDKYNQFDPMGLIVYYM